VRGLQFWPSYIVVMVVVAIAATGLALRTDPTADSGLAAEAEALAAIARLPKDGACSTIVKAGNLEALRRGARFERADLNDLSAGIEVCRAGLRQKANG